MAGTCHFTIATVAEQSADFRRVLWTGRHTQLVIMTIPPGGEIGEETHEDTYQILTFVSGTGEADVAGQTRQVTQGDLTRARKPTPETRTASSTAVQLLRPGSRAATNEYGHPGISCAALLPRPYTWQNARSGAVAASGRSHAETSTASTMRPCASRGTGNAASSRRSRSICTRPALTASYSAP